MALREEVARVLAPMGLRLSLAKTRIVHIRDGFDFLGFRIRWRIKKGTRDQWRLYTFIGKRPLRSLKARIRALTRRTSQQDLRAVLIRINRITRGWAEYFRHAVTKHTFDRLAYFIWWRIVRWGQDQTALEMEGRPPLAAHPNGVAADRGGWDRTAQYCGDTDNPVPSAQHSQPLALLEPRRPTGRDHVPRGASVGQRGCGSGWLSARRRCASRQ